MSVRSCIRPQRRFTLQHLAALGVASASPETWFSYENDPLYIDGGHVFCTSLRIDDLGEDFKKVRKLPLHVRGELDNMTSPGELEV